MAVMFGSLTIREYISVCADKALSGICCEEIHIAYSVISLFLLLTSPTN